MIAYLNFCAADRQQALNLLRWIGEIGGCHRHELILQPSISLHAIGADAELLEEGAKHFQSASLHVPSTEDESGWPKSPNNGWLAAVTHIRELAATVDAKSGRELHWLWLEPDCTPIPLPDGRIWLDGINDAYKSAKMPFMGAEVLQPSHRLSGVAVYPPKVIAFLRNKRMADIFNVRMCGNMPARVEAFDSYFASEFLSYSHITTLIQQVHLVSRDPDVSPTFTDQASLSLLDPRAVLFHRCKDGTLIDRLRERMNPPARLVGVSEPTPPPWEQPAASKVHPAAENKRTAERQAAIEARIAKAMATKAKKKATKAKLKAAWERRKAKVTA